MISMKLDSKFLKEIDKTVKSKNYQNRTEFIRAALREKIDNDNLAEFAKELKKLQGSVKKKTTEKEYEKARKEAFEEITKKFQINSSGL